MYIVKSVEEMQAYVKQLKAEGKSIAFVPTMGYLHEGHVRLISEARNNNDIVITSIFVNPLQFGPNEDFDRYPRDEARDIDIAKENHVDILFMPDKSDMYPSDQGIHMDVTQRCNVLCGKSRTGHFSGVVTVLVKLFNITLPDYVYFGMKDAQQVAVVDLLIRDLNYPITLIPVATVRENDGLAKSSRNVYLNEEERQLAPYIYKGLKYGQKLVVDGEKNPANIVKEVKNYVSNQTHAKIDYVEVLNYPNLTPVKQINNQVILAIAVYFEKARLIDNLVINEDGLLSESIL
ncbi:pantoate--beta-alanine ligase [Aquibacillus albus]|uniref:Pantothenate synthetase n=1 Tax=Aquibacillus albus TaxID=1168171 RepID=A0ABS2MVH8_9BACI|nr:pantoate--beta-alanine ligase [Aquibacillus albus]MBM7569851.1 pantoate--beta-alanine ligase [Aquibacillus albus]